MYKLCKSFPSGVIQSVLRETDGACIPFDPANTDYQQFKQAINDASGSPQDTAQLEDADGVLMTPEAAKAFVATLQ